MIKILVLEDNTKLFKSYLARHILDRLADLKEEVHLIHATKIGEALQVLLGDGVLFGVIDYDAGKAFKAETPDGQLIIRNGAELIATVRAARQKAELPTIPMIGMSSHPAGNTFLTKAGAHGAAEKHQVPELVEQLAKGL